MAYKPQVTNLLNGNRNDIEQTFSSNGVNGIHGIEDLVKKYEGMRSAQELVLATLLSKFETMHDSHSFSSHVHSVVANKLAEAYGDKRIQGAFKQLDTVQIAHNPMVITLAYLVRTYFQDQYDAAMSIAPSSRSSENYDSGSSGSHEDPNYPEIPIRTREARSPNLEVNLIQLTRKVEALAKSWSSEYFTVGVLEYLSSAFTGEKTWSQCLDSLSTYIGSASAIAFWTSTSSAGELAFQRGIKGASSSRRLERLYDLAGTAYATRDATLVLGLLRKPNDVNLLEEELAATAGKNKSRAIPLTPFVNLNWEDSKPGKGTFDLIY